PSPAASVRAAISARRVSASIGGTCLGVYGEGPVEHLPDLRRVALAELDAEQVLAGAVVLGARESVAPAMVVLVELDDVELETLGPTVTVDVQHEAGGLLVRH